MFDLDAGDVVAVLMPLAGRADSTLAGEAFFGVDNLLILEGVEGGVRLGKLTFTVSALWGRGLIELLSFFSSTLPLEERL